MLLKPLIFFVQLILFSSTFCCAQTFIGGSVNVGNFVVAEPSSKGTRKSIWPGGTAIITRLSKIYRNTYVNYGAGIGVLAYTFRIQLLDTLSGGGRDAIPQYSTIYLRTNLSIWQKVHLGSKPHFIGLGGGITLHPALDVRTSFTYEATNNNQSQTVLQASLRNNIAKPVLGFFRAALFKPVGSKLLFGFEYTHHWVPILVGEYAFAHTRSPSFGSLSVYQHEVSFSALVRISQTK
jgi:hypothetical protein